MEIGSEGVLDLSSHPQESAAVKERKREILFCHRKEQTGPLLDICTIQAVWGKDPPQRCFLKVSSKQLSFMAQISGCKIGICRTPSPTPLFSTNLHAYHWFFGTKGTKTSNNKCSAQHVINITGENSGKWETTSPPVNSFQFISSLWLWCTWKEFIYH